MTIERTHAERKLSGRIPLLPSLGVLFAGGSALSAWFLIGPLVGPDAVRGYYRPALHPFTYGYSVPLLMLFVPFVLALLAWRSGARTSLKVLLGGAVLLHLMLLFAPPPQSQDLHQYLFYGRLQAVHHANPYIVAAPRYYLDPWYSWIRWPAQTTVYGPVWTLISYGVVKVAALFGGSHVAAFVVMKVVVFAMDLAVMALIVMAGRDRGDGSLAGWGILAYGWNPLILVSVPLGGLIDISLAAGLVGAYVARRRGHPWVTTLLLTLTTLVKIYAGIGLLLHLVLLARERGAKRAVAHGAFSAGVATVAFAPYWHGPGIFKGLFHVVNLSNHSLTGTLQRLLAPVLSAMGFGGALEDAGAIVRWAGTAVLLLAVVWAVRHVRTEADLWHGIVVVMAVYALVTPWFFYWYLVAPIALVALTPADRLSWPLMTASGSLFFSSAFPPYLLWQVAEVTVRYAPPLGAYVAEGRRRRLAPTGEPGEGPEPAPAAQRGGAASSLPRAPVPVPRDAAAAK